MSTTYIPAELRRLVKYRAKDCCEYCRIPEDATVNGCEVDHIIAEKHNEQTSEENLAYACFFCNRNKGSDLGSYKPNTQDFVRFFNPRIDSWAEHFVIDPTDHATILSLTEIGEVTARIFGFNDPNRIQERQLQYKLEITLADS
ncbi:MAG: HNH endonuclease signature motif containing protein [Armatimonadaceae bacterium]